MKELKALLWKEWQEYKYILLSGILLLVFAWAFSILMTQYTEIFGWWNREMFSTCCLYGFLGVFSIFGVIPFGGEFLRNTKTYLLSKPLTIRKIFWVKYLFGIIILIVLLTGTFVFKCLDFPYIDDYGHQVYSVYIMSGILIFTVTFFTLFLTKSSISAIMLSPIIFVVTSIILIPAIVVLLPLIIYLAINSNGFILTTSILLTTTILFLILSYAVWRNAVSRDLKTTRTLLILAGILLMGSLGVHTIFYVYSSISLHLAISEAEKAGLSLSVSKNTGLDENDRKATELFHQAFELCNNLGGKFDEITRLRNNDDKSAKLESLLLEIPDSAKLYDLIREATSLPSYKLETKPSLCLFMYPSSKDFDMLQFLSSWCNSRGNILLKNKKYPEAFESFKTSFKLNAAYPEIPMRRKTSSIHSSFFNYSPICNIMQIPADPAYLDDFKQLLNYFEKYHDFEKYRENIHRDEASIYKSTYDILINSKLDHVKYIELFTSGKSYDNVDDYFPYLIIKFYTSPLGKPVLKMDAASFIRLHVEDLQDSQGKNKVKFLNVKSYEKDIPYLIKSILEGMPILAKIYLKIAQYDNGNWLKEEKARIDSAKIALGLKIYKTIHGSYPDSLTALVPEVFQELPLDPYSGENYKYSKKGNGFILHSAGENGRDYNGKYYNSSMTSGTFNGYDN